MDTSAFHYQLPASSIAQSVVEPRHQSRLLDARTLQDHRFLELSSLLNPGDLLVLNDTRVRSARVEAVRSETGGKVELLVLKELPGSIWECLARPARRLRPGVVLHIGAEPATVVTNLGDGLIRLSFESDEVETLIERAGTVPLPPYFEGHLHDPGRYQTVYARRVGSAAAPTAGLHFTSEVFASLQEKGVQVAAVELQVSLDTFRPIAVDRIEDHQMHSEWCSVSEETATAIEECRRRGGSVVAVGTTVVRTLESFAQGDLVRPGSQDTSIFLRPGVEIRVVDLLITNFHLPGSTLLVLLEAFMGPEWRHTYQTAVERGYRFLSFGDAMLANRRGATHQTSYSPLP